MIFPAGSGKHHREGNYWGPSASVGVSVLGVSVGQQRRVHEDPGASAGPGWAPHWRPGQPRLPCPAASPPPPPGVGAGRSALAPGAAALGQRVGGSPHPAPLGSLAPRGSLCRGGTSLLKAGALPQCLGGPPGSWCSRSPSRAWVGSAPGASPPPPPPRSRCPGPVWCRAGPRAPHSEPRAPGRAPRPRPLWAELLAGHGVRQAPTAPVLPTPCLERPPVTRVPAV